MSKACLRETQAQTYIELVQQGYEILYLVSDSLSTSRIKLFQQTYPERVVNLGIAEQNLMGVAAGLANGGFIPITGNATPFLISRSNEQLKIDISYSNSNVKVNGMHAGFSYGTDGVTHHEVNDISIMRGFPNFEIYAPCDPRECGLITTYAIKERSGPVYISLNSGFFPNLTAANHKFVPGEPIHLASGNDITIIALGTATHDVLEAQLLLGGRCQADIFALTSIRPLNAVPLLESIRRTGRVLTVEQHSTHGGAGSLIAERMAESGIGGKLQRLGIPEGVFTKNWSAPDNKRYFHLDAVGIEAAVMRSLAD